MMFMVSALWEVFPAILEERIDELLDSARPNALKAFQIYKTCKNEGLSSASIETFSQHLDQFFALPRSQRRKSHFDIFLDQPMDHEIYSRFHLDFRNAVVDESELNNLASWAHNLIRVCKQTTSAFTGLDTITRTLLKITNPSIFEKAKNIEFSDFCAAWKSTVLKLFGNRFDSELSLVVEELSWLNSELKKPQARVAVVRVTPEVTLTQTEITWLNDVRNAAINDGGFDAGSSFV